MNHPHATHIKVVAIIHLVLGALGMLGAIVIGLFVLLGAGAAAAAGGGDPDAAAAAGILGVFGMVIVVVVGVMALPQLLGGWGLLKGRGWAKILILILSAFSLLSVPIGTALGIYGFWALLHHDADAALASLDPDTALYG
ncbi:MAG: hypothetical protein KDD82_01140 [Planctomycetes bacterium]|nr:hypothetical protein [Planctomycetota bacterium]